MNSAASVPDNSTVSTPEEVIDWHSFYNNFGREKYNGVWWEADPDNWFTKFYSLFTGDVETARNLYNKYLTDLNNRNEAKAVQSARAWDEYMSNTSYSRAFKDLEKMGVNPYILLNSGASPATSVGSAAKPSYQYSKAGTKDASGSSGHGRDLALTILAIAKIIALMAAQPYYWTGLPTLKTTAFQVPGRTARLRECRLMKYMQPSVKTVIINFIWQLTSR